MGRKSATQSTTQNLALSANGTSAKSKSKRQSKKAQAPVKSSKRSRVTWKFQLNENNDQELWLMDELARLKNSRKMLPTIRMALMLYFDLQSGNTNALRDFFPGVVASFSGTSANAEVNALLLDLRRTIDAKLGVQVNLTDGILKPKSSRDISDFAFDDDDETVASPAVASIDAGQNFLDSMFDF